MTIRVLLADDHPMYLYGLTAVLDQAEAIEVVASVADGAALLAAATDSPPTSSSRTCRCPTSTG